MKTVTEKAEALAASLGYSIVRGAMKNGIPIIDAVTLTKNTPDGESLVWTGEGIEPLHNFLVNESMKRKDQRERKKRGERKAVLNEVFQAHKGTMKKSAEEKQALKEKNEQGGRIKHALMKAKELTVGLEWLLTTGVSQNDFCKTHGVKNKTVLKEAIKTAERYLRNTI